MKVIFKDTQEVKDVKFGYAVHHLIPKGLAELATPEKIAELKASQARKRSKRASQAQKDQKIAQKVNGQKITIKAKVKKDGQLYGSVPASKIKSEVEKLIKEPLLSSLQVELKEAIKTTGAYQVGLKIGKAGAKVKVEVKSEA